MYLFNIADKRPDECGVVFSPELAQHPVTGDIVSNLAIYETKPGAMLEQMDYVLGVLFKCKELIPDRFGYVNLFRFGHPVPNGWEGQHGRLKVDITPVQGFEIGFAYDVENEDEDKAYWKTAMDMLNAKMLKIAWLQTTEPHTPENAIVPGTDTMKNGHDQD